MEKTLTVSIAAYNVENYIKQALDSLIDQSIIDDLEILVIDDGGADRTFKIAQDYADLYPQSIFPVHKKNGGYGSTINTGIEMATGKYFKQLDGDDWFQTENLKKLIDIMKKVSVDCILTDYIRYNEITGQSTYINMYPYIENGEFQLEQSGIKDRFSMYMSAFRTEILKNMPNRLTEHCFYTDIEYSALPIPFVNTIYMFHKAIYMYRTGIEGQSMNRSGIAKHYQEHEYVFWRLFDVYGSLPVEKKVNKRIFQALLEYRLKEHYDFLFFLPDNVLARKEIKNFTGLTQEKCPEILCSVAKNFRKIKAMDRHMFFLIPLIRFREKRNWKKDGRQIQ